VNLVKRPVSCSIRSWSIFLVLELSEFDGVSVAGIEDDLNDIDLGAAADVELESVL